MKVKQHGKLILRSWQSFKR